VALAAVARATADGVLAAWVDPGDRLDPASAAAAGVDLDRLLWLRGAPSSLPEALSALGTILASGLFEAVVLDLAGTPPADLRRCPASTWIRLERLVEGTPTALLVVADGHVACGPGGVSLVLRPAGARFSGASGPGRLLRGLATEARAGVHAGRTTTALELRALA
jgi:hypothetical protein